MRANFDRLIDGAAGAARTSCGGFSPELRSWSVASAASWSSASGGGGVEGVREVLGGGAVLAGFYSYGEISPFTRARGASYIIRR